MHILRPKHLVAVRVDYFMPDYIHVLNEFYWQTRDYWPDIPRIHKFLWYWHNNIEAVINQVYVQQCDEMQWRFLDFEKEMMKWK